MVRAVVAVLWVLSMYSAVRAQLPYQPTVPNTATGRFSNAELQRQLEGRAPGMPHAPVIAARPQAWPGGSATSGAAGGVTNPYPQATPNYPQTATPYQTPAYSPPAVTPTSAPTTGAGGEYGMDAATSMGYGMPTMQRGAAPPAAAPTVTQGMAQAPPVAAAPTYAGGDRLDAATSMGYGMPSTRRRAPINVPVANGGGAPAGGGFDQVIQGFDEARTDLEYPRVETIDSATIIARVSDEVILAGDIQASVTDIMTKNADKIRPGQEDAIREMLTKRQLKDLIETKAIYVDVKRNIPDDRFPSVIEQLEQGFEEQHVADMMERAEAKNRAELESKLSEMGSSVARQKQNFVERTLARQWVRNQLPEEEYIVLADLKDYYNEHVEEFSFPAGVRYEQIMVRFEHYATREEAWEKLRAAGNQVWQGRSFAEVAKEASDGDTAEEGGVFDWTALEDVVSRPLQHTLATLPVNRLSQIIEDFQGFQIVRVLERREAGRRSFLEAQVEIREKLEQERLNAATQKVIDEIVGRAKIWTVYGDVFEDQRLAEEAKSARR